MSDEREALETAIALLTRWDETRSEMSGAGTVEGDTRAFLAKADTILSPRGEGTDIYDRIDAAFPDASPKGEGAEAVALAGLDDYLSGRLAECKTDEGRQIMREWIAALAALSPQGALRASPSVTTEGHEAAVVGEEKFASGCGYTGYEFGAGYPDSTCIDGYLWDLDSCDEPGGGLTVGGDIHCPSCNPEPAPSPTAGDE